MKTLVLLLSLLVCSFAAYSSSDDVISVTTQAEFNKQVLNSDELVLVEFYAPWCGHCKNLEPEWKKAASALKGIVKIVAVDADAHKDLGGPYGIKGFPTIKFFGNNKKSPEDYQGGRTAKDIVDFATKEVSKLASARLSGKAGKSSGGKKSNDKANDKKDTKKDSGSSAVVNLSAASFKELVLGSDEPWMVEFFAPWCGHCKTLAPQWETASKRLKGKVNLGAVDATVESGLAQEYGVQGYPTIKVFGAGKKDKSSVRDYSGGRNADEITQWALKELSVDDTPVPEIVELVDATVWEKQCSPPALCVLSVLPHILDSGAKGRNQYLDVLKQVAKRNKRKSFSYVWTSALDQPQLEQALGVGGFGYPALSVINLKKGRVASLAGPFNEDGINNFLAALVRGQETTRPLSDADKIPVIQVAAWDGKDGAVAEEDPIDLAELGLDFGNKEETVNAYKKEL